MLEKRGAEPLALPSLTEHPVFNPATEQLLCRLDDIPDGQSRGFLRRRNADLIFAVRQGDAVFIYLNACPHQWLEMELAKDQFLTASRVEIMCYAHGAHFDIRTGACTQGPCEDQFLIAVPHRIEDGLIVIGKQLPPIPYGP
jgi:nitrite reductase/ring-hydroxylating ferredoxin subunit